MKAISKVIATITGSLCAVVTAVASPVAVDWKAGETAPTKVARPFAGFLPDGRFVVAGGSDFVDGKKVYRSGIYARAQDGKWSKVGELPHPIAEGVCCETPFGLFCAGGTDGKTVFTNTFEIIVNKLAEHGLDVYRGLRLPKPVKMGAAAYHDGLFFVIASKDVYGIDLKRGASRFVKIGEMPGPAREQIVAAVQNGDQKEKMLIVAGGFDKETKKPLRDVYGLVLSSVRMPWSESKEGNPKLRLDDVYDDPDFISHPAQMKWKKLADLPEGVTTIGAAFLPSGHQHILLVGGFGEKGWIDRAINGSKETDPVKLGWQRKILAYNCVTDAWCEYGELAPGDSPRCGAAAGIKPGKTPEQYTLILAGGEVAPMKRTDAVSVASFKKTGKFGATAWAVVGVYALLMVAMAVYFIRKKKDENDYFRGGNRIPWYVAGMSIFATMLSSITFIAIPTQAYLQDWRYFVMAFFIIGMAPVAIYYYLPFFCRLGITSASGSSARRRSSCSWSAASRS